MLVWIQQHDFKAIEYPDSSLDDAFQLYATYDWSHQMDMASSAKLAGKEYCDPGIGLVAPDSHILHICPSLGSLCDVFLHYKSPARWLGIISYMQSQTAISHSFSRDQLPVIFESHFQGDNLKTAKTIKHHE